MPPVGLCSWLCHIYLGDSNNSLFLFFFFFGSTMLHQTETNFHIPQISLTVTLFLDFHSNFYFRNIEEDNISKVVKNLIKVIKL